MLLRGPFALEVVLCGSGSPRIFRSWSWSWCKGDEGVLVLGVGAVADLGGEALLDVVRVGRRGGGREGALGVGGLRRRRERERLGLPMTRVRTLLVFAVVHNSFLSY